MALSRRQRSTPFNIWPGFVDALAQLLMVIIFVLLVFTVGQFTLSGLVSDRDASLKRLTQQLNELSDLLALEKQANTDLRVNTSQLSSQLQSATAARDSLTGRLAELSNKVDEATAQANRATEERERLATDDEQRIAILNQNVQALRAQLTALAAALDLAQQTNKDQQVKLADLGQRLNTALANKLEELARYRSEFFGRLREILGDRPDIRVVGDRFVFQSEVLFSQASADLADDAKTQLQPLATALKELIGKIPPDLNWVLRVDGHTDRRPISTGQFPSNWELSTARAISVVKYLVDQGIPADRLAATGFGEFQPVDKGNDEAAFRRNRRIELKLTER
jgi:chemotaxis protein MotB